MEYAFHVYNKLATDGAAMSLSRLLDGAYYQKKHKRRGDGLRSRQNSAFDEQENGLPDLPPAPPPIVVCVGSDLAIGDSLGPIVGSMLQYKTQGLSTFLYGTLSAPVTAKEIGTLRAFLRETHRDCQVLAIDAAVGNEGDIGLIKILDQPLKPGAGANKNLGEVGNLSIMGVVAEKSVSNYAIFNQTRLNLVYKMSDVISDALSSLLYQINNLSIPREPSL